MHSLTEYQERIVLEKIPWRASLNQGTLLGVKIHFSFGKVLMMSDVNEQDLGYVKNAQACTVVILFLDICKFGQLDIKADMEDEALLCWLKLFR